MLSHIYKNKNNIVTNNIDMSMMTKFNILDYKIIRIFIQNILIINNSLFLLSLPKKSTLNILYSDSINDMSHNNIKLLNKFFDNIVIYGSSKDNPIPDKLLPNADCTIIIWPQINFYLKNNDKTIKLEKKYFNNIKILLILSPTDINMKVDDHTPIIKPIIFDKFKSKLYIYYFN